jgi:acid phosphatase (class A)
MELPITEGSHRAPFFFGKLIKTTIQDVPMTTMRIRVMAATFLVSVLLSAETTAPSYAADAAGTPAPAAVVYLEPGAVDLTRLLGPPPLPGSAAQMRDLAALHLAQDSRNAEDVVRVQADARVNIAAFASVLGQSFKEENLPLLTQFFRNVSRATGPFISVSKDCWSRPRPFATDPTIVPPPGLKESAGMRADSAIPKIINPRCTPGTEPSQYSYAYPSGHATFGAMTAIQLADMVPELRQAIFERGWEFGYSRVLAGVHYPGDVEAGRIQATVLVAMMQQNRNYQRDFAAARQELRQQLGYPK